MIHHKIIDSSQNYRWIIDSSQNCVCQDIYKNVKKWGHFMKTIFQTFYYESMYKLSNTPTTFRFTEKLERNKHPLELMCNMNVYIGLWPIKTRFKSRNAEQKHT